MLAAVVRLGVGHLVADQIELGERRNRILERRVGAIDPVSKWPTTTPVPSKPAAHSLSTPSRASPQLITFFGLTGLIMTGLIRLSSGALFTRVTSGLAWSAAAPEAST